MVSYYYLDDTEECYDYISENGWLGDNPSINYPTYKEHFNHFKTTNQEELLEYNIDIEIKKLIYIKKGLTATLIGYQLLNNKLIKKEKIRDYSDNLYWKDFIVWSRKNKINNIMKL